jgi:hypothetical protein
MKARTKLMLAVAGAISALALGSLAGAAIVDGNGVIHGCYDKGSGQLRVTDTATNQPKGCSTKEAAITWNQQGPQGPQGEAGPSEARVLSRPDPKPVGINTTVGALGNVSTNTLVTAKVVIGTTQHDFSIPFCSLYGGPDLLDQSRAAIYGPGGALTTLYLTGAIVTGGVSAYVVCTEPDGYAENVVITATRVGSAGNV